MFCRKSNIKLSSEYSLSGDQAQGYKTFFMLNSAEHEICSANKSQVTNNSKIFLAQHS